MRRSYLLKIFLFAIIVLSAKINLFATEYFITTLNEFYSLPDLTPGDVVVLKNGVWEDAWIEFEGTGTESNPITLKAETAGEVIFTGNSSMEIGGEYLIVDGFVYTQGAKSSGNVIAFRSSSTDLAYHCRLTNTMIYNYNPSSKSTEYKWVSLYGQYNRVDHCYFEGKNHAGAMMVVWLDDQPNYHQIDSNYFGARPDLGVNGGETIRIGTSDWSMYDSYTTVEGNVFEECDGEIEIISNKSCKNVYSNNTFRNSEGTLTLRHGNECKVYGNYFFGSNTKNCGGIRIIGEDHKVYNNYLQDIPGSGFRAAISITNGVPDSPLNRYFQVLNAEVVNNTIVNCEHPFVIGSGADTELSLPPKDCHIANNVVVDYSSVTDEIIEYNDEPENMTFQNNIMYGADLGIDPQDGILQEDPVLVLTDLWRPTSTSNVVGFGVDTFSYVTTDIDGQIRETTNDVGCDQVSEDLIFNHPLEKEDVGVNWDESNIFKDNAYLQDLRLDGQTVSGFAYNLFSYEEIVVDTNSYVISATKQDDAASIEIEYPDAIPGVCTITVTAGNGINTETYTISLTANITSLEDVYSVETGFRFYPNPCQDLLVVETKESGYAHIYDQSGRLVRELQIDNTLTSHDISDLQPGYYHVSYMSLGETQSKSLIIR